MGDLSFSPDLRSWSLWIDRRTGALRANEITPTWGGGGFVVVPAPGQAGPLPVLDSED
ncbi:MAG: hypothetical protein ACYCQK_02000 [Acidiferrobacteraceae bacterium]